MAAQVEVQAGEVVGRTGVGGRLHLSPLTDSSNKSLTEGTASIHGSLIITSEPSKSALSPKPRLTPKPFAVEKNPTIRPILAPKPQPKPRPESTRPLSYKPDPPSTPKPQQPNVGVTSKARPVLTNPSRPAPTSFKPSPKLNTGQTTKPVAQPFKPAPPLPIGDSRKPTPPKPAERQKPMALGGSAKPPAAEWSGSTKKEAEKSLGSGSRLGASSMTRAKSMGFLSQIGQVEEEEMREEEKKVPPTVALRPQSKGSRPRPVSAIYLSSPTQAETSTPAPPWTVRRPLSADLTSKFESIGLSLHRKPPNTDSKENTPEEGAPLRRREREKAPEMALPTPQGSDGGAAKPAASDPGNDRGKEGTEKVEEKTGGSSIKRRISLLLDSSSPAVGVAGQGPEPRSPVQPISEAELPLEGVKQRIRQLTVDIPPTQNPVVKPTPRPRPLPLDLTKRFTPDGSTDLGSPLLSEATDHRDSASDPQSRVDVSAPTSSDQTRMTEDTIRAQEQITVTSPSPVAVRADELQPMGNVFKERESVGGVQTVRASLFENVVERHSVQVLADDLPKDKGNALLRSLSIKQRDNGDDGTLVTATYREPVSPSSPMRVMHSFDTVQAVEGSRAVSESVPSAHLEDKAMTLRSRRSEGNRPTALDGTPPVQGDTGHAQPPRYLRVGALPRWDASGPEQEVDMEKGSQRELEKERQLALERQREAEGQRDAEREEAAAAPKRPKMLEADEHPKPRATYFALTGQIQEPVSLADEPLDNVSARAGQWGSQGKIVQFRRNPSLDEAFAKSLQSPFQGEEPMERTQVSETDRGSMRDKHTAGEAMDVEKQRDTRAEADRQREMKNELEREKQRQLDIERQKHLEFARMKERERQREFERQRQKEYEKEKQRELERQKKIEIERQQELEREKTQKLEKERQRELERQRQMEIEKEKQQDLERERQLQLEKERQRDLERQRLLEMENRRQQELERQREQESKRERQLEKERQLQLEKERQRDLERQKLLELENRRQQELESERQREQESERQRQLGQERQLQLEKERQRDLERQKLLEMENRRQQELESEKQRQLEKERQKQVELERERQKELERERHRLEKEKQRELERERQREAERERREMDKQREIERERQRELERQEREKERQREMEKERQREMEKERQREMEKRRELEKERQRELEKERKREVERQRELDKERRLLEMQKERHRLEEVEMFKEMERRRLMEFEQQKKEMERQELEKQRLREKEEADKLRQMALQLEAERLREAEQERLKELEKEQQRELERLRQRDLERQKKLDFERQEMENQKMRQLEMEKETRRKEELERIKEMELRQLQEFEKQKQAQRESMQLAELEKQRLRERMAREEAEKMRQVAKKEKQRREERADPSPLRPKVLDLDSKGLSQRDPSSRWKQPSPRTDEPYKPVILDIDSFKSQTQHSPRKELLPVAGIQDVCADVGAKPLTPERANKGAPETILPWTSSVQDPWELNAGEMSVDRPAAAPEPPRKPANKPSLDQLLLKHEERHQTPEKRLSALADEPPHAIACLRRDPGRAGSPGRAPCSNNTPMELMWAPKESELQGRTGNARGQRRSQGSQELNRMRSRSVSRRSMPSESSAEASLSRMRSRSAHRERDQLSWVQQKQSGGGEDEGKDTDTLVHETDSQYGTWETGLHTDDSLTPATPSSDSNLSPSPRKPTPPQTPDEPAPSIDTDTPDGLSPSSPSETEPLNFPEIPTTLLDTSALRCRAQLGKKRAPRSRPSRAARQSTALTAVAEAQAGATEDWRYRDSTEEKVETKQEESDSEDQARASDSRTAPSSQPQRVALFPGMDPSALKAQLKKRGESDGQLDGAAPSQLSRSPKSPFLPRAARVLPPSGGKENGEEESPQWLRELKSKKRLSQYENDG